MKRKSIPEKFVKNFWASISKMSKKNDLEAIETLTILYEQIRKNLPILFYIHITEIFRKSMIKPKKIKARK